MALIHSPRKTVPLAGGDDWVPRTRTRSDVPTITKRVFFCGVVVEGSDNGCEIPEDVDVQELLHTFGLMLGPESDSIPAQSPSLDTYTSTTGPQNRRRALTNTSALAENIKELVVTERSYVNRLKVLKNDYADPLRTFAKTKDTAIIDPYNAKALFGNIDLLIPVNQAFLKDLECMDSPGGPGVGDVALKHFKTLKGFHQYKQYYDNRAHSQEIFETQVKKSSQFAAYIDRIKYSSADATTRVGLRELLMEPVQRIPRYTLLFRLMVKHMAPDDPQRAKLIEADALAARIAQAEATEETRRATTLHTLQTNIEGFPPGLISHGRRFVDWLDVEDPIDAGSGAAGGGSLANAGDGSAQGSLHCTLLLFDDKLMIVKRPGNNNLSGRALVGLDDLDKATAGTTKGGMLSLKRKPRPQMSCKGVVDITDVNATDVGGTDMHLYLESPPHDQGAAWSGRAFRALTVVHPSSNNRDTKAVEDNKTRFLESLWHLQGRSRTRHERSVVLQAEEREVENSRGKTTIARTYFNIYTPSSWSMEDKKTKIVVQIDPLGTADSVAFGGRGAPYVVVKVHPIPGALCRYEVMSNDPNDESENDIVHSDLLAGRIINTIHQYGLFKFRTGHNSQPSTPTAARARAAVFGLDAISRNLFAARPGSAMGDLFGVGGSTRSRPRSRSAASRTSMYTTNTSTTSTTATTDSGLSRFSQATSTLTAATSVMDEEHESKESKSSRRSRSGSDTRKLVKRKEPMSEEVMSEPEMDREAEASTSVGKRRGTPKISRARSESAADELRSDEDEDEDEEILRFPLFRDPSEVDLATRLALARRNSKAQAEGRYTRMNPEHVDETIYEDDPNPARPLSRTSRQLPEIPTDELSTPTRARTPDMSPVHRARSLSRDPSDRRPMGPRSPSPLPPRTPSPMPPRALSPAPPQPLLLTDIPSMEADLAHDATLVNAPHTPPSPVTPVKSRIPRSKRQPFEPTENVETPKAERAVGEVARNVNVAPVEPLSIKKKNSVAKSPITPRRSPSSPRSSMRSVRDSPRGRRGGNGGTRKVSTGSMGAAIAALDAIPSTSEEAARLIRLVETTKQDIESSRRAVKRIRLENEKLRSFAPSLDSPPALFSLNSPPQFEGPFRSPSPVKATRPPFSRTRTPPPQTKEAEARREELQRMVALRKQRARTQTMYSQSPSASRSLSETPTSPGTPIHVREVSGAIDDLLEEADRALEKLVDNEEAIQSDAEVIVAELKQRSSDLVTAQAQLRSAHVQVETLKRFIDDADQEKDIMYDAFNEELDAMYNDANLPEDEAWAGMTKDLRNAKKAEKNLAQENLHLKRRLEEVEMQKEEWGALLRAHGLIP